MNARTLRRSLAGAVVAGGLFGVVSLYRSWVAPGPLLDYVGPVGLMVVIGATVGGLVGPLVARAVERRRDDDEGAAEPEGAGSAERDGAAGNETVEAPPSGQPLWLTLLVGLSVGFGVGTAWDRIWAGVGLGVVLALTARRVFR